MLYYNATFFFLISTVKVKSSPRHSHIFLQCSDARKVEKDCDALHFHRAEMSELPRFAGQEQLEVTGLLVDESQMGQKMSTVQLREILNFRNVCECGACNVWCSA